MGVMLFVVVCGRCLLIVVICSLLVGCCLMFRCCCLLVIAYCCLFRGSCFLPLVSCCVLFVVFCFLVSLHVFFVKKIVHRCMFLVPC